jgi:hypothetical protein
MYSTPELLLVGAAQHLVLGDSLLVVGTFPDCADSEDARTEAGATYIDPTAW